jgi:hypothetical protein
MNTEAKVETLEVAELEYDVASLGAEEASSSESNHAAFLIVAYRLPEAAR